MTLPCNQEENKSAGSSQLSATLSCNCFTSTFISALSCCKELQYNPHAILGIHKDQATDTTWIRLYRPGAQKIFIELYGRHIVEMQKSTDWGLFEIAADSQIKATEYKIYHSSGLLAHDPYVFLPTFDETDQYLFSQGTHYELYKKMGARLTVHQGVEGVSFAVWAPSAQSVSLVGDFNLWDGKVTPMRSLGKCGVWEIFIPGLACETKYKFEIKTLSNEIVLKSDPYGLQFEFRPKNASCVAQYTCFEWTDQAWIHNRYQEIDILNKPMNIYEVHLSSWKKKDTSFLTYQELAHELADYCLFMNFTHIELMPVTEHPFDDSWGYQVTGYFAPTSRFGLLSDFQYFVNHFHMKGIGVILDWVPGHFPNDDFALYRFDGTALYEHADPRQGFHPHWHTSIFNFGRHEVSNFLIASALYWIEVMHIDGLRIDAVASMLYLDYGRLDGEWIPNKWGGKENIDAIEFIKHLNSVVHQRHPGVVMIAEESTSFPCMTTPVEKQGLGFDLKWNMGWMNDILCYFHTDPFFRSHHHNKLTFGLLYAFSEKFQLVLSHDEVVHGKKSLLNKMPGDVWQKFANIRLLYSYMICHPGKKLYFMGGEIGQWNEWNASGQIEWFLLEFFYHKALQKCVRELNQLYRTHSALWADDFSNNGFEWVDFSDQKNSVVSYIRKHPSTEKAILCVHNFTPTYHSSYSIPLKYVKSMHEIFNSDETKYGGSGKVQTSYLFFQSEHTFETKASFSLAPLATILFEIEWE